MFPPVVNLKPALLIACATLSPVTRLVVSPELTVPFILAVKGVVLTANLLLTVVIVVSSVFAVTLYGSVAAPVPVTVVLPPSAIDVPFVLILPIVSVNCFTLTASVSSVPALTFVILLPPLLSPSVVTDTFFAGSAFAIVTPLLFTVVAPVVTEPVSVKSNCFASLMSILLPSAFTEILLSVTSPVAPPAIVNVSPSFLLTAVLPSSPVKFKPPLTVVVKLVISVVFLSTAFLLATSAITTSVGLSPFLSTTFKVTLPSASALYLPSLPAVGFATK